MVGWIIGRDKEVDNKIYEPAICCPGRIRIKKATSLESHSAAAGTWNIGACSVRFLIKQHPQLSSGAHHRHKFPLSLGTEGSARKSIIYVFYISGGFSFYYLELGICWYFQSQIHVINFGIKFLVRFQKQLWPRRDEKRQSNEMNKSRRRRRTPIRWSHALLFGKDVFIWTKFNLRFVVILRKRLCGRVALKNVYWLNVPEFRYKSPL